MIIEILFSFKDMTGNCFVGGSYRGLLSLVRHSNNDGSVGIFWIIVSAVCHLRTLQITGYFGKEDKSTKSTDFKSQTQDHKKCDFKIDMKKKLNFRCHEGTFSMIKP